MAEVYEAEHTRFVAHFAVKVLLDEIAKREDVLKRFQREAEITSALRHPNIVNVVDFNRLPDGSPYLVMEFLDGVDLAARLQSEGPMPLDKVLDIVGQLASGLTAAHSQKIVHRDVKPQNLFLVRVAGDEREVVKILDFGISKVREATTRLTRQSSVMGTPQYMAPEQARGLIEEIDERTDEFSVAAITYELVAGQPPFRGELIDAILYQVVHEEPPPLVRAMPAVERVIQRGMAKNKTDRFASVREFHLALVQAVNSEKLRPGPEVPATVLTPDALSKVDGLSSREPAGRSRSQTTLGSAAKSVAGDTVEAGRGSRLLLRVAVLAAVLLSGAGIATALLWPRHSQELQRTAPMVSPGPVTPVAAPVVLGKDASPPAGRPDIAMPVAIPAVPVTRPEPTPKASEPAKAEAKPTGPRKKKSQIRMEDL